MLQPLGDRVLVKPLKAEEKSPGGIILPETAQEAPREGEVVAVGEGRMLESGDRTEMSVEKGDRIIYREYGGTDVKIDGEEYLIVEESAILAVRE
jgi:chaperonin GroES